jgi:hypothetical protein
MQGVTDGAALALRFEVSLWGAGNGHSVCLAADERAAWAVAGVAENIRYGLAQQLGLMAAMHVVAGRAAQRAVAGEHVTLGLVTAAAKKLLTLGAKRRARAVVWVVASRAFQLGVT